MCLMTSGPPTTRTTHPHAGAPVGFGLAGAFTGSFVAVTLTQVLALPDTWGLALVALVVVLSSIDATWPSAVGIAVLSWLFVTGFVTNSLGELRFNGPRDGPLPILLVGLAVLSGVATRPEHRTHPRIMGGATLPSQPIITWYERKTG